MFEKKAYSVQMSFDIPDSEKRVAEKAEEHFQQLNRKVKKAVDHLLLIYNPFSSLQSVDNDQILDNRRVFRKYRRQVRKNFEDIFKRSFRTVLLMSEFGTDTKTKSLMNSFMSVIDELQKLVAVFLSIFDNLSNSNFAVELVSSIDAIRKKCNQLRQLINDRILQHIDTNILAKDWMSSVSDKYQYKVDEKLPLVVELYKERQEALQSDKG